MTGQTTKNVLFGMVLGGIVQVSMAVEPVVVPASELGSFMTLGQNRIAPEENSNVVGIRGGVSGLPSPGSSPSEYRGFLNFDLAMLSDPVASATLRLNVADYLSEQRLYDGASQPPSCFSVPGLGETFHVTEVSTPLAELLQDYPGLPIYNYDGRPVFADLGDGVYGQFVMTAGDFGFVDVPLNSAAVAAINAAAGGDISLGLDIQQDALPASIYGTFCPPEHFKMWLSGIVDSHELILVPDTTVVPSCNIAMSQSFYREGDVITMSTLEVSASGEGYTPIEIKVWMDIPGGEPVSIVRAGGDGDVHIWGGTSDDWGGAAIWAVDHNTPKGSYVASCRILNPTTGEILAEDYAPFSVGGS